MRSYCLHCNTIQSGQTNKQTNKQTNTHTQPGMLIQSNPIPKSNPIDQILGNRYRDFSNRYFSLTIQSISTIENFIDFSSIFLSIFLDNFIDISLYFHRYFSIFSSIFLYIFIDISRYFSRYFSIIPSIFLDILSLFISYLKSYFIVL